MSHIQSQQIESKFKAKYPIMLFPLRIESRFMRIGSESSGPTGPGDVELDVTLRLMNDLEDPIVTSSPGGIKTGINSLSTQYTRFSTTLRASQEKEATPVLQSSNQQWKLASILAKWKRLSPSVMEQYKKGMNKLKAQSEQLQVAIKALEKETTFQLGKGVSDLPTTFFMPIQKGIQATEQILKYSAAAKELSSDTLMDRMTNIEQQVKTVQSQLAGINYVSKADQTKLQELTKNLIVKVASWNELAQIKINGEVDEGQKITDQLNSILKTHEQIMTDYQPSKEDSLFIDSWMLLETFRQNLSTIKKRKEQCDLIDLYKVITENNGIFDSIIEQLNTRGRKVEYTYTDIIILIQEATLLQEHLATSAANLSTNIAYRTKVNQELAGFLMKFTNISVSKATPAMDRAELNSLLKLYQQINDIFELRSKQTERFGIKEISAAQFKLGVLLEQFAKQLFYRDTFNASDYNRFKELVGKIIDGHAIWNLDISRIADQLKFEAASIRKASTIQASKLALLSKAVYRTKFKHQADTWGHLQALNKLLDYAISEEGLANIAETNTMLEQVQNHSKLLVERLPKIEGLTEAMKFNLQRVSGKFYGLAKNMAAGQDQLLTKISSEIDLTKKALEQLKQVQAIPTQKSVTLPLEREMMMLQFFSFLTELDLSANHTYASGDLYKKIGLLKNRVFEATDLFDGYKAISYTSQQSLVKTVDSFILLCHQRVDQLHEQYSKMTNRSWSQMVYDTLSMLDKAISPYVIKDTKATYFKLWKLNAEMETLAHLIEARSALDISVALDVEVLTDRVSEYQTALSTIKELPNGVKSIFNKTQHKVQQVLAKAIHQVKIKQNPIRYALYQFEKQYPQVTAVKDIKVDGRIKPLDETSKTSISTATDSTSKLLTRSASLIQPEEQMYSSMDIVNSMIKVVEQTSIIDRLNTDDFNALNNEVESITKVYPTWKNQVETTLKEGDAQIASLEAHSDRITTQLAASSDTMAGLSRRSGGIVLEPSGPIDEGPTGPTGPGDPGDPGDPSDTVDSEENELWIRAYPDDIAIDAHETALTEAEIEAGKAYWNEVWYALNDRKKELGAWRALVRSYGPERAAWIVRVLTPTNISSKPTGPVSEEPQEEPQLMLRASIPAPTQTVAPTYPNVATRVESWNDPAKTRILPDQLVFILYKGDQKVAEVIGNNIPSELVMGINPADDQTFSPSANGDLSVGPELNWMFDFDEAVAKGMAIRIPISDVDADPNDPDSGFSRVLVLGVKHSKTITETQSLVENLFDSHHYVDEGMGFIAPGTPTNNNGDAKSEFNVFDNDDEKSFDTEVNGKLFSKTTNPLYRTDGQLLAEVLGIDESVFQNIHGSDRLSIRNSEVANTSLWSGTFGFYLEELFDFMGEFQEHPLNLPDDLDTIREHFIDFVKSRGALPSLRVGSQPYGILPVSAMYHDSWKWLDDNTPFNQFLVDLLIKKIWGGKNPSTPYGAPPNGSHKWDKIVKEDLRSVDDPLDVSSGASDLQKLVAAQERFMGILGLTATSSSFYNRYLIGSDSGYQSLFSSNGGNNFGTWMNFAHTFDNEFSDFIEFLDFENTYGPPTNGSVRTPDSMIIGNLRAVNNHAQLLGQTVDKYKASSDRQLIKDDQSQNYIQWLLNQDIQTIHETAIQGDDPSNSLLYLMLRQALLSQYWDAAMKIYESIELRDFRYKHILIQMKEDTGLDWEQMTLADYDINKYEYDQAYLVELMITDWDAFNAVEDRANRRVGEFLNNDTEYKTTHLHRHSYKWFKVGVRDLDGNGIPTDRLPDDNELVVASNRWPFLFFEFDKNDLPGLGTNQTITMADYLKQGYGNQHFTQETANLRDFITNMNLLAQLSTQDLELLMTEHIDACSHRLDAWLLSLVNKRVEKLRDANVNNKGLHLGAFGWVIDLKPGQTRTDTSGSPIVYTEDDNGANIPIANDPDNQGFIHAPSLNHAVTAAILKAGYNATGKNELLEVNLSSARVRQAMFYIEGIRNGQHLGALLGYQLERGMHDNNSEELDQYILDLRKAFPLVADTLLDSDASEAIETIQANQVIDGLKLLEKMREVPYPYGVSTLPSIGSSTGLAIQAEVQRIEGDLDAVGDLSLAEGVFQVAQGNYARSNAMMKAVSDGSYIPQPEIIDTPRTGQTLTHRSLISMKPVSSSTKAPLWTAGMTPKAKAEPSLNYWLGELLGDPGNIRCIVYVTKDSAPNNPIRREVTVKNFGIQPIDLMYWMNNEFKGRRTVLSKRIAGFSVSGAGLVAGDTILDIDFRWEERGSNWGTYGVKTFVEIAPLIQNAYKLINDGRYLRGDDLVHPSFDTESLTNPFGLDIAQLTSRVQQISADMDFAAWVLNARMNNLEANVTVSTFYSVSSWLNTCGNYGIDEAVGDVPPEYVIDQARADRLLARAASILEIMAKRQAAFDVEMAKLNEGSLNEIEQVEVLNGAAQAIFGKEFKVIPNFVLFNASEIQSAYTSKEDIIPQEPLAMERWLSGVSRVREKMWTLENVMLSATMMELTLSGNTADYTGEDPELSALQLPFRPNDNWVGLETPENYFSNHNNDAVQVSRDKLSLVGWLNPGFNTQTSFAGILVDEWNEVIPNREETTGVAFHYDQPNARPPQTVLLGIHPENSDNSPWKWKHLVDTLHCTLDLAKVRAVEPDQLVVKEYDSTFSYFDAFAHILPGVVGRVGANDPEVDNVLSTDFNTNIDDPLFEYYTPTDPNGGSGGTGNPGPGGGTEGATSGS